MPRKQSNIIRPRQELFFEEWWSNGCNLAKAAEKMGYSWTTGRDLLQTPKGKAWIEQKKKSSRERYELNEDWVIQRLMNIADANMGEIMDKLRKNDYDLSCLTFNERYAISAVTDEVYMEGRGEDAQEIKKVKVTGRDNVAALIALCRKLGLFVEKVEVSGEISVVQRLQSARQRMVTAPTIDATFEEVK